MRALLIIFLCLLLYSCDNRNENLLDTGSTPIVLFSFKNKELNAYTDTVKLTSSLYNYIPITLLLPDTLKNTRKLEFNVSGGTGTMYYRGEPIMNPLPFSLGETILKYIPNNTGTSTIKFTITNKFNKTSEANLKLVTITNLAPVANFDFTVIGSVSKLEYEINASKSFDADRTFGGHIVKYAYTINGQLIETTQDKIKYIFPSPGIYQINLTVTDDEGLASATVSKQVNVN